jgi:hypothetical protein
MNTPDEVVVKTKVPMRRVADLLCAGFEGGIGYWAVITGYVKPEDFGGQRRRFMGGETPKYIDYPLSPCGAVLIEEVENDDHVQLRLDYPAVERGLEIMQDKYPRHFGNWLSEDDDATTGDVFIQCCLFGKIVYG